MRRMLRGLPLAAVALLAACGGGGEGKPVTTEAAPPTQTGIVTVTVPNTANAKAVPTGTPKFKISITASAHTVRAGEPIRFTVRAVDANGKPAPGTAKMRVFLGRHAVDTLGFFPFTGSLKRGYRFSPLLKGKDVILQAEVEGNGGTQRANWAVRVT